MTDEDWMAINEWIADVHSGSDGFYIDSRLVVALRDEVERLLALTAMAERAARMFSDDSDRLRSQKAQMREIVQAVACPPQGVPLVPVYVTPEQYKWACDLAKMFNPA